MRHEGYWGPKYKTRLTVGRHMNKTMPGKHIRIRSAGVRSGGMVVQLEWAAERPIQDSRKGSGSARAMSAAPGGQNPQWKNTGIPEQYQKNSKRLLRVCTELWIGTLDRWGILVRNLSGYNSLSKLPILASIILYSETCTLFLNLYIY